MVYSLLLQIVSLDLYGVAFGFHTHYGGVMALKDRSTHALESMVLLQQRRHQQTNHASSDYSTAVATLLHYLINFYEQGNNPSHQSLLLDLIDSHVPGVTEGLRAELVAAQVENPHHTLIKAVDFVSANLAQMQRWLTPESDLLSRLELLQASAVWEHVPGGGSSRVQTVVDGKLFQALGICYREHFTIRNIVTILREDGESEEAGQQRLRALLVQDNIYSQFEIYGNQSPEMERLLSQWLCTDRFSP